MGFLPKDYEAPKGSSNYLKLEEGQNKFRVVSSAVVGYEYWTNGNKPVRLKNYPETKPADVRLADDNSYVIKHFWAFIVLDRKDAKVKILELTQGSIMRAIEDLVVNEDWGDPKQYDITISRTGSGMETRYTVQPSPHKELTAEEKSLVARMEIDLEKLFDGENPFESKAGASPIKTEEVKIEDIPFD
jgi:hypothetical protein